MHGGFTVGARVGFVLGSGCGEPLGSSVGIDVGSCEGSYVGNILDDFVGAVVGEASMQRKENSAIAATTYSFESIIIANVIINSTATQLSKIKIVQKFENVPQKWTKSSKK